MSNATVKIEYSKSLLLKVHNADNQLVGFLGPDTGGRDATVFMYNGDGFGGRPGTTVNLVPTLESIGGSPVLALIGSNFAGPAHFKFSIIADGEEKSSVNEKKLSEYASEQWSFHLVKV